MVTRYSARGDRFVFHDGGGPRCVMRHVVSGRALVLPPFNQSPHLCTMPVGYLVQDVCGHLVLYVDEVPNPNTPAHGTLSEQYVRSLVLDEHGCPESSRAPVSAVLMRCGRVAPQSWKLGRCMTDGVVSVMLGPDVLEFDVGIEMAELEWDSSADEALEALYPSSVCPVSPSTFDCYGSSLGSA